MSNWLSKLFKKEHVNNIESVKGTVSEVPVYDSIVNELHNKLMSIYNDGQPKSRQRMEIVARDLVGTVYKGHLITKLETLTDDPNNIRIYITLRDVL